MDLAMAEEDWDDPPEELVPASSPALVRPQTPPSRTRASRSNVMATRTERNGSSIDSSFSSPVCTTAAVASVRVEVSPARTIVNQPASTSTTPQVTGPRTVYVGVQHKWSKEVEQKLRQVFKLPKFRTHQKEAIDETMAGKDGKRTKGCS